MGKLSKIILLAILGILVFLYFHYDLGSLLTFENLKNQQDSLTEHFSANRWTFIGSYFAIYVLVTALSLPGATIMTLAGGAIFGLWTGLIIVSFASTIGASLAFLASRFFLRSLVQKKFSEKITTINRGIEKDGAFYLFTLRLIPVFPFFMINLSMGLTPIRLATFYWVSQVGMLAGTFVYVNAGTQLAQLSSLRGIFSPKLLFSFALLGLFPLIAKKIIEAIKSRQSLKQYEKPKQFDYNVIALGAGAAGLVSSYIAAAVKAKVALIEKNKMGGDCLNTGCVPSKALIKTASVAHSIKQAHEFGITTNSEEKNIEVNFSQVMERIRKVITKIEPHDSVERYTKLGVDCVQGEAEIKSPYEVVVNGKTLTTKNIIVATGAAPLVPKIKGLEKIQYLTSDTVWGLRELPKKLIVLGGGPIGSELTQAFARLGSQVIQVEKSERLLQKEDPEVSQFITDEFRKEGVTVLTGHEAKEFVTEGDKKFLICEHQGKDVILEFDQILIAVGRLARTQGYGLEDLGIELNENGTIQVNEYLQTNYPNIYACGDVAGPYQFTHVAAHQAWFASVNSLFGRFKKFRVDYRVIPWCTYCSPEIARVGLNESEAREKGIEFEVTRYDISDLDRAITEEEDHGFVKVLTAPGKDKILGVTIVGHHAGEIIAEYVAAMKHGFGLNAILGTIHIYPTFSEANKYAAGEWKRAHAPQNLLRWVEKYHRWIRS